MHLQLPAFFKELKGEAVFAELRDRQMGMLWPRPQLPSDLLCAVMVFCREVGLRLDLRDLAEINAPVEDLDNAQKAHAKSVIESIAVFAAVFMLSRSESVSLKFRKVMLKSCGMIIEVSISPFGQRSDDLLTLPHSEASAEISNSTDPAQDSDVDLLGGRYAIGKVEGSAVEGPVYDAFYSAAMNYVLPLISATSVDVRIECAAIDPDCVPKNAEKAVAAVLASALRLFFLSEYPN